MDVPFGMIIEQQVREQFAKNVDVLVDAIRRGNLDEVLHPPQTPQDVKADAKERSWRTLVQQLGIDVTVAIVAVVFPVIMNSEDLGAVQWSILGTLVLKTILSTVASYAFRLWVSPKSTNQISLSEANRAL